MRSLTYHVNKSVLCKDIHVFPDSAPERGLLVFLVASVMVQVQFRFVGPMMERERERERESESEFVLP